MRIRNQPDLHAVGRQLRERRRHIVVQLEVMAARPLRIDFTRARVQHAVRAPLSAHFLDDVTRVGDEELVVVRRALRVVEQGGGARDRRLEFQRIDVDVVPPRKCLITLAAEGRSGIDQGEVDVKDDGLSAEHRHLESHISPQSSVSSR